MQVKRLSLFLILISLIAFLPLKSSKSKVNCGGYDPSAFEPYQFFEPLNFEELSIIDGREESEWATSENNNLVSWESYFNNQVNKDAINQIIYKVSSQDMQNIRAYVQNANKPLSEELKRNALVKYWQRNPDLPTIDYIFFAKVCEPHVKRVSYWEDEKPQDKSTMRWLYNEGQKYYQERAKNNFLKMRYAYQIVRLAHYVEDYNKAVQIYNKFAQPLFAKSNDIIKYWALGHKAGALYNLGQEGKAAYIFAQIFDKSPSRRLSSFLSFTISNEREWKLALQQCQNKDEKVNLYFLRALDKNSNSIEEMQSIYQINPSSKKLNMLLVREINKLEYDLLGRELSKNLLFFETRAKFPKNQALNYLKSLKNLVTKALQTNKIQNKNLWELANGYLSYLDGNIQQAKNIFQKVQSKGDAELKKRAKIFSLALEVSTLKNIDAKAENQLFKQVMNTNHHHLKEMTFRAFGRLYKAQGETGKAYICKPYAYQPYDLRVRGSLDIVEDLIKVAQKPQQTFFEQQKIPSLDVLFEIKATTLFSQDKLDEALTFYNKVSRKAIGELERNPFVGNIHDFGHRRDRIDNFNRKDFAQQLSNLKKQAKNAQDYLQIGNAYYNMTYFGNAWYAIDYYRSSADLGWKSSKDYKGKELIILDCSKAKSYYQKAFDLANKANNRELATEALFMIGKCEQNEYYISTERSWGYTEPTYDSQYRQAFSKMKNSYSDTKYYKKALNECSYFYNFVY